MSDQPAPTVTHHPEHRRFVADTGSGEAVLTYEPSGDRMLDLQHTVVPEAARGSGVGDALVRAAVAHAREQGVQLVPTCPFVAAWAKRHGGDADVFVGG